MIALSLVSRFEPDWEMAQNCCLEYSEHPNPVFRGRAFLGFADILLVHDRLNHELVNSVLEQGRKDAHSFPNEMAHLAAERIEEIL